MLTVLKKLCSRCNYRMIPISSKFCEECEVNAVEEKKVIAKHYDKHLRNKKSKSFYNSKEWLDIRAILLKRYFNLDLYDYYVNRKITKANTVHHIEELNEAWEKRLDINNLFPLTSNNHNKIDALYNSDKKAAQNMLRELKQRFEIEFIGGGG